MVLTRTEAGYWLIGRDNGIRISVELRPRWLHRFAMHHLLGIEWIDELHKVQVFPKEWSA